MELTFLDTFSGVHTKNRLLEVGSKVVQLFDYFVIDHLKKLAKRKIFCNMCQLGVCGDKAVPALEEFILSLH